MNIIKAFVTITVSLGRCNESCNAFDELSNKICVPREREDVKLNFFNMITRTKEWKILTK